MLDVFETVIFVLVVKTKFLVLDHCNCTHCIWPVLETPRIPFSVLGVEAFNLAWMFG